MKYILLIVFFFYYPHLNSQATSVEPEQLARTPDSTVFNIYLDSIDYYLDVNQKVAQKYIERCEELLNSDADLTSRSKGKYLYWKIFMESSIGNYIHAYQLLKDKRPLLPEDVPEDLIYDIKYLEGFILSSLGDVEAAQSNYEEYIAYGEKVNDQSIIHIGLFLLAQLQSDNKMYKEAEKNLMKVYEEVIQNPMFVFDFQISIINNSIKNEDYDEALKHLQIAENLIEQLEYHRFSSDYKNALALYHTSQNNDKEALVIYEEMISEDLKENPKHTIKLYEDIHKVYAKVGRHEEAYSYLQKNKALQEIIFNESNLRQVRFLNTKFEVERKEKENQILAAQVSQEKTQNRFLFVLAGFFLLGSLALLGVAWQKANFNRDLEKEVVRQTQKLRESNMELEQFNYILSHDLKEPVRNIIGFSTLSNKRVDKDHPISKYLQYISRSGKQLYTLIEDVSTFHQIDQLEHGKFKPVDLNDLVSKVEDSLLSTLEKKKGKLTPDKLPTVLSHESILFIVLKNLIENGLKYNESEVPTIQVSYKKEKDVHQLLVKDNGIGIDKEFHSNIFGMFKRLNDREKYGGAGLGLSLSQKSIRKLGGEVSILSSESGKGSTFLISFPAIGTVQKQKSDLLTSQG